MERRAWQCHSELNFNETWNCWTFRKFLTGRGIQRTQLPEAPAVEQRGNYMPGLLKVKHSQSTQTSWYGETSPLQTCWFLFTWENKVLRASWAILESCYVSRSSVYPRKMLNTQRLLARRLTVPFGIVLRELLYIWALYKIVFHLLFYIYTILPYVSAQVPLHASIWFWTWEVQKEMGGVNRGAHSLLTRP